MNHQGKTVAFRLNPKELRPALVVSHDAAKGSATLIIFTKDFNDTDFLPGEATGCSDGFFRRQNVKEGPAVGEWTAKWPEEEAKQPEGAA